MNTKKIICSDCSIEFTFSIEDQAFFKEKGFDDPRRCPKCRIRRRELNYGKTPSSSTGDKYQTLCADCGTTTYVPFKPNPNHLIYCRFCFESHSLKKRSNTPSEGVKV